MILTDVNGTTDVFGRAYEPPAGSLKPTPSAIPGHSRPSRTSPKYSGQELLRRRDHEHRLSVWSSPASGGKPAYPSGHTIYGYMELLLLALLVPERYQQMVTRAAEYGNDRIVLGAHYAMDVLAVGRWPNTTSPSCWPTRPGYVGVKRGDVEIDDFPEALAAARAELTAALEKACGGKIADCAAQDQSRFADPVKNSAFYEATQTYGLPVVFAKNAQGTEDVVKLAPEAGYLLTVAFPSLTLAQADAILTVTEGPGGGFLDNGSAFGVYSRLDLYKAAEQAAALSARGK